MYLTTVFKKEERNGRKARARRKKRPHRLMHRAQRSGRLGGKGALGPGTRKPQGRPRRRAALRRPAPSSKPSTRDSWQPPARGGQRHPPQEGTPEPRLPPAQSTPTQVHPICCPAPLGTKTLQDQAESRKQHLPGVVLVLQFLKPAFLS